MQDKITICFSDGRQKEVEMPKYGEIKFVVRNGKVADIETNKKEKIC